MGKGGNGKSLIVPYLGEKGPEVLKGAYSRPWPDYPYLPRVEFRLGLTDREILLQFDVREETVRAELSRINDMVCSDSCVEFFVNPGDGSYFNFEVNPIGTLYAAHGFCREDSRPLPPEEVARITSRGSAGREPFPERQGPDTWSVFLAIPLSLFRGYDLCEPRGRSFRANFYKCGDELSTPHYACWNRIGTASPDFHRPEYFGEICFESPRDLT